MDVHFVGSVNLPDIESVFRLASSEVGDGLHRIPDGEVGRPFGAWLMPTILASPDIYAVEGSGPLAGVVPELRLNDDVTEVRVGELGIAAAARESYARFRQLRDEGVIREGVRFQMGVPSTFTLSTLGELSCQERINDGLMRAMKAEIEGMVQSIPHKDLAIQIEMPGEIAVLEGVFPAWLGTDLEKIVALINELTSEIPEAVQLGIHLCYGDPPPTEGARGEHWADPKDAGLLARVARTLLSGVDRSLQWIHVPVPIDRDDDAFFAPLAEIDLPTGCRLFLGLVHDEDGLEGSKRRIAAALTARSDFGVATECGMGRLPEEVIPQVFRLHRETAEQA